ncbi:MAG: hypothetical protein WCY21_04575 [Candidatus Cloacimonadaceae bacterium]|jgi:hypothetical protein|nr:hypothetical protein [Candidatus Cloacimonadota bacterium]MDX9950205.1 hypothetical protein [Candidatus Syntrophosphaera sp.]
MKILFYPGKPDLEPRTGLAHFVHNVLRKKSQRQWQKMDFWLQEVRRNDVNYLQNMIHEEATKSRKNKKLASLGDGLYEYRGQQSKAGTIRLYFCFDETTVHILDAEYKTSDEHKIDRARKRKQEMNL